MPSDIRRNNVSGDLVILARDRARRPRDHNLIEAPSSPASCPFCPGASTKTPAPIRSHTSPAYPGHKAAIRVVPNLYPALTPEQPWQARAEGPYDTFTGVGAHEVVIEAPDHVVSWLEVSAEHIAEILASWQDRIRDLRQDPRIRDIIPFKNVGPRSGATLAHAHSQILALPLLSPRQQRLLDRGESHFAHHGRCPMCDAIDQECRTEERLILASDELIAWAPYGSRASFEVWIAPRIHQADFTQAHPAILLQLADHIRQILARWEHALGPVDHNLVLHSAPFAFAGKPYYHWHLEMLPRLSTHGGFEWGSGAYINATASEVAARHLRDLNC
ncbi:galactose-1-phosphate uridylyltransferase [Lujinxingia litoralis]|uniref:Galactose-1-phosphate uridylyltransferase n=1 Tax=Lujinxingia litoralis TaxID=2211119 RepID=A0A328C838_9DELT|nr:DUF4931 domain-containing protein [Lujinxingia litoralis]RAL23740.1 galactose-1-phosphate uridylyltransferase [Lujinxingia litoralis]